MHRKALITTAIPEESIKETIKFINSHSIQGLKIHSTYVIKNTKLADLYLNKEYEPIKITADRLKIQGVLYGIVRKYN